MSSLILFLFKLSRQRNVPSDFVLVTSISFPDTWVVFLFQAAQAAPVSCRSSSSAPFPSAPPATRPPCTASTPTASCTSSCSTSSTYFRFVEEVGWMSRTPERNYIFKDLITRFLFSFGLLAYFKSGNLDRDVLTQLVATTALG